MSEAGTEPVLDSTARLSSARTKLLRVKRHLEELNVRSRAGKTEQPELRPALPASYFVGLDIETDIDRIADELLLDLEDLGRLL